MFTFVKSNKIAAKSSFLYLNVDMKDRIKQLMEGQHMTQQTFANFIGISPATLCSIFLGRTKPTLNIVELICSKFPNINLEWLMKGKGPVFTDSDEGQAESPTPQEGGEQVLNFGNADGQNNATVVNPNGQNVNAFAGNAMGYNSAGQKAHVRTDIICSEKSTRKITEIRVFYDDQTWESFVPKK